MEGRCGSGIFRLEIWIHWYRKEGGHCRLVYVPSERPAPEVDERVKQPDTVHGMLRNAVRSSLSPDYVRSNGSCESSLPALYLGAEEQREQLFFYWNASAFFHLRREPEGSDSIPPFLTGEIGKSSTAASYISAPTIATEDGTVISSTRDRNVTRDQPTMRTRALPVYGYNQIAVS